MLQGFQRAALLGAVLLSSCTGIIVQDYAEGEGLASSVQAGSSGTSSTLGPAAGGPAASAGAANPSGGSVGTSGNGGSFVGTGGTNSGGTDPGTGGSDPDPDPNPGAGGDETGAGGTAPEPDPDPDPDPEPDPDPDPGTGGTAGTGGTSSGGSGGTSSGGCRIMLGDVPVCCTPTGENRTNVDEVFELLNAYRASLGLSALAVDPELEEAMQGHCMHMELADFFAHDSPVPELQTPWARAEYCGSSANGENIAGGQSSPASVMTAWKNSSGHDANMRGNYQRVGIGEYAHQWGQLFGG